MDPGPEHCPIMQVVHSTLTVGVISNKIARIVPIRECLHMYSQRPTLRYCPERMEGALVDKGMNHTARRTPKL